MRLPAVLAAACGPILVVAQVPDLSVRLDLAGTFRYHERVRTVRLYDAFANVSTVAIRGTLEPGYKFQFTQKLDRIPGDADQEWFQEVYLEDENIWRVGKQFLPFGSGQVYREAATAARGDTNLLVEGLPIAGALIDSGKGKPSGAMLRIGDLIHASVAYGRHFGVNATALGLIRAPEDALGKDRGYRQVFGFGASRRSGNGTFSIEGIQFGRGETPQDRDFGLVDASYRWRGEGGSLWTIGYTGTTEGDHLRVLAQIVAHRNAMLEPFVRVKKGGLFDVGFNLRVRL